MTDAVLGGQELLLATAAAVGRALNSANLRTTTALTGIAALVTILAGGPVAAQDTGAACTIVGGVACDLSTPIVNGTDGPPAGFHDSGHPGTPGNLGGDITSDLEAARALSNSGSVSPINAVTVGGKGGNGSNSNPADDLTINKDGGSGAAGQNAGNINLTVGSALSGSTIFVNGGPATSGMTLISLGGAGGDAGIASFETAKSATANPARVVTAAW